MKKIRENSVFGWSFEIAIIPQVRHLGTQVSFERRNSALSSNDSFFSFSFLDFEIFETLEIE